MPSIIASVVQCCTVYNDTPATIARMRSLAEKCKKEHNSQLVVFPEAFIGGEHFYFLLMCVAFHYCTVLNTIRLPVDAHPGYPKFSTFGVSIGNRTQEGREEYVQYHKNAISLQSGNDQEVKQIEDIARELEIFIVSGFIEKEGGTLYCAVGFWDPIKGFLYSRRKVSYSFIYCKDSMQECLIPT